MGTSIEKKIKIAFGCVLVILALIGWTMAWSTRQFADATTSRTHSQKTLQLIRNISEGITNVETASNNYVITADPVTAARAMAEKMKISADLNVLGELTRDSPVQQIHVRALRPEIRDLMARFSRVVETRGERGFEAARDAVAQNLPRSADDQANSILKEMESEEVRLAKKADEEVGKRAHTAVLSVLIGSLLPLVVLGFVFRLTLAEIGERRRAEKALSETEQFQARMLESSGDCVQVLDLDGLLVSMNTEGRKKLGIKRFSTIAGKSFVNFWHGDGPHLAQDAVTKARGGGTARFQGMFPSVAGVPKWWDVMLTPVLGVDSLPEKLLAVMRDVTENRAAQDKFRVLFEHSANAHLLFDEGGILDCNAACVELLRCRRKEHVFGKHFEDFSPVRQPDGIRSVDRLADLHYIARQTGSVGYEWQLRRPNGEEFPVEVNITTVDLAGRQVLLAVWHDLTDRKRAEAALRESEERFQAFMNNSPAVAYIKDADGCYVYINKVFADRFRVTLEDLLGKTDFDWLPKEVAETVFESDRDVIAANKVERVNQIMPAADGEVLEWLMLKFPMSTSGGKKLLGGVGIDITKQKQAERALEESEAQFRDLFDDAPVAYHELDPENRLTRVNATELGMLGYGPEEMVGRPVWDFIVEGSIDDTIPAEIAAELRLEATQRTFRRKDGTEIPVLMRHRLITDSNGGILGMRSTLQDISALKRTERELRDAEEKYRSIFENAVEGIYQSTPEGRFRDANPALARIYGYESADRLLSSVTDVGKQIYVDPQRRAAFVTIMASAGEVTDFESEIYRKDGSIIWVTEQARAVRGADGVIIFYEGTVVDITARRETEEAIRNARDAALESARLKSEFLANMSHEIRTPMNGIIGMTGLLMDTEMNPKQRDFAQTIADSADGLLTIINDILDFSKIEAGMLVFEEIAFQLDQVVEGAVELLAERAMSKKVVLASLVNVDAPSFLMGDPGRVRQVLTNLIGNAIKFTEKGEVMVSAELDSESDTHAVIRFTVADTGIGIHPETQERLFQAFVQADGSTTRRYGGTGLGLAICKQLVEQMGGRIGLESNVGQGSTFWFTGRFAKQEPGILTQQETPQDLKNIRVLTVDDTETGRRILKYLFGKWKMLENQVSSGHDALEVMRRTAAAGHPFELAVIDMHMSEMDGLSLARIIKSDPKLASVRIVMLSSLDHMGAPDEMREAGVQAYLRKPIKQAQLFECLRQTISSDIPTRTIAAGLTVFLPEEEEGLAPSTPDVEVLRILIAEDNIVNQKVALHQLQRLGFLAQAVDNGKAALDAMRHTQYDVVFMDCQMPELDGYGATREIRKREGSSRHTWVIAMTANSLEGDREKCLAAGMDDYVSKPVKPDDLQSALDRYMDVREAGCQLDDGVSGPVIDLTMLESFREFDSDGESLLAKLIDVFLENSPRLIAEAKMGLQKNDIVVLSRSAHTLKGSCSNFGAERLRTACAKLELMGNSDDFKSAAEILAAIEREFNLVRTALDRERPVAEQLSTPA